MGLFDFFTETIGVDPGSQNLRIAGNGEVIFNEPSVISVNRESGTVSGIGNAIVHDPGHSLIYPVNYAVGDFVGFEEMLKGAIKKGSKGNSVLRPSLRIYFCVPSTVSQVEKRAYRDSGEHSGAKEVMMLHSCFSSAIGLNILLEKKDFILIDFGSSKVEITVFANSIPVEIAVIKLGIHKLFSLIKNYIYRNYKIRTIDEDIETILSEFKNDSSLNDLQTKQIAIKRKEVQDLLDHYFELVNDTLLETIEKVYDHPSMKNIRANGVYFTGGGSSIGLVIENMKPVAELKQHVGKTPELDSINGLIKVMADPKKYADYIVK